RRTAQRIVKNQNREKRIRSHCKTQCLHFFRRGVDSVKPVQIDVHRRAAALHNHLLKCPAPRLRRTLSVPKITRTRFKRAKKQKQREHETSEHHLHPGSSRLAVCWYEAPRKINPNFCSCRCTLFQTFRKNR